MRVGWAAFILPFAFVSTPALLFEGALSDTLLAAGLTAVGIGAVTSGITGYWGGPLGLALRLVLTGLGALALPLGFIDIPLLLHAGAGGAVVLLAAALLVRKSRAIESGPAT